MPERERPRLTAPAVVLVALLLGAAIYAIDHGVYVGSVMYQTSPRSGALRFNIMRCRYLFITGVSEIDAADGQAIAPDKPDGHCRLFAE